MEQQRTRFFLFGLRHTDKRKLAYGLNPEDALTILSFRLTKQEMRSIVRDDVIVLHHQREIPQYARAGKLA